MSFARSPDPSDPAVDAYRILQVHPEAVQPVIRAAYRALAALYHPDTSREPSAGRKMAQLNAAYALVRGPDERARYDADRRRQAAQAAAEAQPVVRSTPVPAAPAATASARRDLRRPGSTMGTRLDFGRYVGWSLGEIQRHDPSYLLWLRRHSGGTRYRREIDDMVSRPLAAASAR